MVRSVSPVRIALALVLPALPALSGCVLFNEGAVDIGPTSATLQAGGRTDDESAYVHFEYARSQSDLGTAKATKTPERGPVPPHTPASGRAVTFPERITGLLPGRQYWSRVCGRIAGTSASPCTAASTFLTTPTDAQDHLTGWGTDGFTWDISVSAAAGSHGEDPEGRLYLVPTKGMKFDSIQLTCLRASGDTVTVGSTGLWTPNYYDPHPVPGHALLTVIRDAAAPYGNRAYINQAGPGGGAPDCADGGATTPFAVHALQNEFTLRDAP